MRDARFERSRNERRREPFRGAWRGAGASGCFGLSRRCSSTNARGQRAPRVTFCIFRKGLHQRWRRQWGSHPCLRCSLRPHHCDRTEYVSVDPAPATIPQADTIGTSILATSPKAQGDFVLCSHTLHYIPAEEWLRHLERLVSWMSPAGITVAEFMLNLLPISHPPTRARP